VAMAKGKRPEVVNGYHPDIKYTGTPMGEMLIKVTGVVLEVANAPCRLIDELTGLIRRPVTEK